MDFTPAFASSFLSWHAYIVSKENNVGNSKGYFFFSDIPYHIVQLNTEAECQYGHFKIQNKICSRTPILQ